MKSIFNGKDQILSGDQDAIEKLKKKLENLKDMQARMKEANKAIRMKDMEKGDDLLKNMGSWLGAHRKPFLLNTSLTSGSGFSSNNSCSLILSVFSTTLKNLFSVSLQK